MTWDKKQQRVVFQMSFFRKCRQEVAPIEEQCESVAQNTRSSDLLRLTQGSFRGMVIKSTFADIYISYLNDEKLYFGCIDDIVTDSGTRGKLMK